MGFKEILDRISRTMAAMEQTILHYRASFTLLRELNRRYVDDYLRNPATYYGTLSRLRFSAFGIRQLLELIALDRAEIEIRVAQDLSAQGSDEPHAGQQTPEISAAGGQRAIAGGEIHGEHGRVILEEPWHHSPSQWIGHIVNAGT